MKDKIKIGTRGSDLALYQAEFVKAKILIDFPLLNVEIVKIKTSGDSARRSPGNPLETKRVFTREIEDALIKGDVDVAVHSAKDMAAVLPKGLKIAAALEREDFRDCFISKNKMKFGELPMGARIGTSALRRKTQLLRWNPELTIEELHGNVGTRIRKMEEGHLDGIILAYAGIKRLGLVNHVTEIFDQKLIYPAPTQGIIAAEIREQDSETEDIVQVINHDASRIQLDCERGFLKKLQGGCQLPCGMITQVGTEHIYVSGILLSLGRRYWVETSVSGEVKDAERVGEQLAEQILAQGGEEILQEIKKSSAPKS